MKLKHAYETAAAMGDAAELMQFITLQGLPNRPASYRCVGDDAANTIAKFLDEAGLTGRYSIEESAVDSSNKRIVWVDTTVSNELQAAVAAQRNPEAYAGCPFNEDSRVTITVTPAAPAPEPVDLIAACESAVETINSRPETVVGIRFSDYTPAVLQPLVAEICARHRNPSRFEGRGPVFDGPVFQYAAARHVRMDERLTPVQGFFCAPFSRTIGADEDDGPNVFRGYCAISKTEVEALKREGRPVTVVFAEGTLKPDLQTLQFMSDRAAFHKYIADIYDEVYGDGGKFKIVVDQRSRIVTENARLAGDRVLSGKVGAWDDVERTGHPFGAQFVLYIVPKELMPEDSVAVSNSRMQATSSVKVVSDLGESAAKFGDGFISHEQLPVEWFAMTHVAKIGNADEDPSAYWGRYDELDRITNTAAVKKKFAEFAANTNLHAAMCAVASSESFTMRELPERRSYDEIQEGPAPAAFVAGVGAVLRLAWNKATDENMLPTALYPDAVAGSVHDPSSLVCAVYSGMATDKSPDLASWLDDPKNLPFPKLTLRHTDKADWTRFLDALPDSGAMARGAGKTPGTSRKYYAIAETNLDYHKFMQAIATSDEIDTGKLRFLLMHTAVSTLLFRRQSPTAAFEYLDGQSMGTMLYGTQNATMLPDLVSKELSGTGSVYGMLGDTFSIREALSPCGWEVDDNVFVEFAEDAHGRLSVMFEMSGMKVFLAHLVYRMYNRLRISSASYATTCCPVKVPDGTVSIPQGSERDFGKLVKYAAEVIKSNVGTTDCQFAHPGCQSKQFWSPWMLWPFNDYSNDANDWCAPSADWFSSIQNAVKWPMKVSDLIA